MSQTITKPKFAPDRKHYPSILKQGWNSQFFRFGKAEFPGVSYFNPGLVQRPDGLWLITRRSEAVQHMRIGMNSLMAFKLGDRNEPQYGKVIKCKSKFDREHFEDPRAIYHNGKTYISCCNFIVFPNVVKEKWTGAHICMQIVPQAVDNWDSETRIDPVYGNNGDSLATIKGLEKNWLWFFHKNQLHLLYQTNPHTIVKWSDDFQIIDQWNEENDMAHWTYGDIRGGTPPVFHDGLYWTFFHSSIPLENKYRRRYYMGAYAFEPFPPFKIVKFTKEPLLAGSDEDLWAEKKPLVVFPCGAINQDGVWLVSIGVNDLLSAWVEIPHENLLMKTGERRYGGMRRLNDDKYATTTAVIAYLPPPNFGHTQIFLKNLTEHPPSSKLLFISDYPWPDSERITDPSSIYDSKDKIACYVFLKALEMAEKRGLQSFTYLETDCRVSGTDWDKAFSSALDTDQIAAGNLAICGEDTGGFLFKLGASRLGNKVQSGDSVDKNSVIIHGKCGDDPVPFVNGAPACYSVKALRELIGNVPIEAVVERMTNSDQSLGVMAVNAYGSTGALNKYSHVDEVMATAGEVIYPFSVRKQSLESGIVNAVHPIKNRWRPKPRGGTSFYHCGDLGDIIYSLKAIQLYGGGKLVLGPKCYSKFPPRSPISKEIFSLLAPLLDQQKYLSSVSFSAMWDDWDYDLNDFRTLWNEREQKNVNVNTLAEAHCHFLGVEPLWNLDPWLIAGEEKVSRFVIHRSHRYREESFPWRMIMDRYRKESVFVGLKDEHDDFIHRFGPVDFLKVESFDHMAQVINGSEMFIGNQSAPCSIALGLGKRVWQETWLASPDCVFPRASFYNGTDFPEDLK